VYISFQTISFMFSDERLNGCSPTRAVKGSGNRACSMLYDFGVCRQVRVTEDLFLAIHAMARQVSKRH
jgi:hypothetical protein